MVEPPIMNARIAAKIAGSTRQKRKRGRPRREEVRAMGRMPTELEKRDNDNRQEERLAVTCEWCDKELAGQKGQRFCSRSHASLFTAQRKTLTECLWCHEGFKARKGQEFCCQAHGVIYRQQHKQQPECQWCHQKVTSARGTRFCSKSHAGFFNAKKRSEDSKQSKREDDQVELDRMDRIAEDVWQRILQQEAAFPGRRQWSPAPGLAWGTPLSQSECV
jgi:hypothetical protein